MKQIKLCITIALLLFFPLTLYCFIPTRITPKKELSKDDIKIKVHLQVTTGPLYYLKEDKNKLWNTIKNTYPDANPKYIQLTGNLPNYAVDDPVLLGDFYIYGKVVGTGTLIIGISLVLGFIVSFWSEIIIDYIILPAVIVGLGFILYGQFKYNKGIF